METILITGPDGAGKSTLISKLKKHQHEGTAFFLVPIANHELKVADEKLSRVLYFINWLYLEAESLKVLGLRELSLFAYMMVYKDLISDFEAQGKKLVVCDRHPLIDSIIYGKQYAPNIEPHTIPAPVLAEIDYNFNAELSFLTQKLGLTKADMPKGACYHLSEYIYRHFLEGYQLGTEGLKQLYHCDYPSRIIWLDIAPEVLKERLKKTKKAIKDTRGASKELVEEYKHLMDEAPVPVERVDANVFGNLDRCADRLIADFF